MDGFKEYTQPDGSMLYWLYDKSQYDCNQAQTALNNLLANLSTDEQRLALFVRVRPNPPLNYTGWRLRGCSGVSTDPQIVVIGTNADYVEDGTTPPVVEPPSSVEYLSKGRLGGYVSTQ